MVKYEEILNKFIEEERAKSCIGSGDDRFYEQQIIDYINKQRPLWIEFMKFMENLTKHNSSSKKDCPDSCVYKNDNIHDCQGYLDMKMKCSRRSPS